MELLDKSNAGPRILVVIVLYLQAPAVSRSVQCLLENLRTTPALARYFSIILYDNSPEAQHLVPEDSVPILYRHDQTNSGLATAFNFALQFAQENGFDWLLLLDQDTSVTLTFLRELVDTAAALLDNCEVASIVPKLLVNGNIYSPGAHFIDQLRHQYQRSGHAEASEAVGIQKGRHLSAYNSGAAFRVSALRTIGGFPREFWLDYLDHAVFHALYLQAYAMYIMKAELEHDISQACVSKVPAWRQLNVIRAQTRFVLQTGNSFDRFLYRIWLLRLTRVLWLKHPDKQLWKDALNQVFSLKTQPEFPPRT
jgi:GT2 family glycosyltransferase